MILLFDRTFISGSLAGALRRSWPLYVGLACTWLLLLALNIGFAARQIGRFRVGSVADLVVDDAIASAAHVFETRCLAIAAPDSLPLALSRNVFAGVGST